MSEAMNTRTSATFADLDTVRHANPDDFDGHTEFYRLSPQQRLAWLDEAVAFITSAKSTKRVSVTPAGRRGN